MGVTDPEYGVAGLGMHGLAGGSGRVYSVTL